MKQLSIITALSLALFIQPQKSMGQDNYIFNHLSLEAEVGSTGWGFNISAPLTPYVTFRTGFTTMPQFHFKDDVSATTYGADINVPAKAKFHMTDFKLLAEIYPFRNCSFHFTGGFYIGKKDLLTAENTEPIHVNNTDEGVKIGDYIITPDADGIAHARLKVNSFKPYVGIGFGRAVPPNHRFNVACDMGVQFWGSPTLEAWSPNDNQWVEVSTTKDGKVNKALNTFSKISVWPVLNFRVIYRIF